MAGSTRYADLTERQKQARRDANKRYVAKNIEKWRAHGTSIRRSRKAWFQCIKERASCVRCGESHSACLDFRHRDGGAKDDLVSAMVRKGRPVAVILAEMEQCDVLCANCYRKERYNPRDDL